MVLEPGDPAPTVEARDQVGERISPGFETPTVLFFYPRDGTPGCTTEATQFDIERETYAAAGVEVYGVSTDDVDAHAAFCDDHDLDITLLADPDGEIATAFDVPIEGDRAARITVVVVDGTVHRVYPSVRPDGHARTVLADLLDDGVVTLDP